MTRTGGTPVLLVIRTGGTPVLLVVRTGGMRVRPDWDSRRMTMHFDDAPHGVSAAAHSARKKKRPGVEPGRAM